MGGTRDHVPVEAQLQVAADRAIELARVRFGERLLDVCCGTGNASAAGAAAGALVTGIDLDESVIRIARERVPAGKFEIADAIHLPFANESFDVAVSTFGVSLLLGQAAVGELLRVVRPGGRIVITAWPETGSILSARSILRRAVAEAQGRPSSVSNSTSWHDRGTVRDLFAPHSVEFFDERIVFEAASSQAVAAQYYDHHPQWLQARQVVGESVYRQLRERATRFFDEVNEHASAWQATDSYLATVATLESEPGRASFPADAGRLERWRLLLRQPRSPAETAAKIENQR